VVTDGLASARFTGALRTIYKPGCTPRTGVHLNYNDTVSNLLWYAVRTNSRQETRVLDNLCAWQVEAFAPKIEERRYPSSAKKPVYLIKPLFPNYVFARFDVNTTLHKIKFTRGVNDVVTFGGMPTPVDDEIIALIKLRTDESGLINFSETFQEGDEVVIKSGPLKTFNGVFVRGTNDAQRVLILLNCVAFQPHIEIEREFLTKAQG
jgi:transcriptional antiterminator RfaH